MDLVEATASDAKYLYNLRFCKSVRRMMKSQDIPSYYDHLEWLKESLKKDSFKLFLVKKEGNNVGYIRVKKQGNFWDLSYAVEPIKRGNGYASMMIKHIYKIFKPLKAEIKRTNIASIKTAENAGMELFFFTDDQSHFIMR